MGWRLDETLKKCTRHQPAGNGNSVPVQPCTSSTRLGGVPTDAMIPSEDHRAP